jgi:hypothetical protein
LKDSRKPRLEDDGKEKLLSGRRDDAVEIEGRTVVFDECVLNAISSQADEKELAL